MKKRKLSTSPVVVFWKDPYFWADGVFLSVPSLGYMATSFVAVGYGASISQVTPNTLSVIRQYYGILQKLRLWNFAFNILYVIDAVLYIWGWYSDGIVRSNQLKEDNLILQVLGPEYQMK